MGRNLSLAKPVSRRRAGSRSRMRAASRSNRHRVTAPPMPIDWFALCSGTEFDPEAQSRRCERLTTSTPNELDRRLDVRVKALFHWTGVRCVFEPLLILRARRPGISNRDSQAIDSSRGSAALPRVRARMEPEGSTPREHPRPQEQPQCRRGESLL